MKTNIVQIMRTHLLLICAALLVPTIFAAEGVDGDNYEEMKVSLRNNPSPMPQKAKALDALTFEAVGDLGVIKGQGETITLYFNVDVDSLDISSASVTMNAYDVDYPRASECDEVYFNGEHLGRLRGGDNVWHENTFAVPVNAINRGKNTIRINVDVDRIGWITAIGWARLTLKGHAIKLTASDGSEPDGIEVKWTDMGSQYQYALYRGTSKDGPFKQIETVKTNSYFDTAVRYGQPYWYYVEASEIGTKAVQAKSVLRSGVDDGLSKSDGELPRIESIEVAPLWLVGAGQYNLELKWNSFDRKRYEIETITFKASKLRDWLGGYECTVSTSGLVDLFGWPCDFNLYDYKFFSKKDGEGDHGDYLLSVAWSVKDKINGRKYKKGPFYKPQLVNVLFDKYGKHKEGFPNWFYYWTQKDNAIDSKYFSLEAPTYDGKFHYVSNIPMLGNSSGDRVAGSHSDNSHERERFRMPISGYPDLIRLNGECTHQYEISDGAVTEGEIIMQKNGDGYSGPKIGSKETGIAQLSKTIQHELCHGANSDSLYAHKGKWVLGTPDKNFSSYESISKIVDSIPDKYQNAPYCMLLRALMNSYGADVIILDLDGDKVPDKDEENKVPKLSKTNPDTYNIQARYSIYATCGDNEVLARKAEEMDTVSFNSNHDWAFPGSKFGQNYQGHCKTDLDKEDFLEFKRNSLFLSSSKQSEQYKRSKAQGSILTTEEENREICREVTAEMSSFEIESPNYEIKCSELEVLPQDETGKYQGLYANLEILNYTNDIPVAVECYLYDDSDNPIVETSKAMVLSNGINMVCMKFDGGILSRRGGLGYAVGGIRLLSMQTDCFYYMASSTNKVTTSRTYSSDEFCKPLAYLQKDKFSHAIDDTNLIVYANVISSQDLKNSTIEARLTNTNGLDVAKAYFTGDLWTGTNSCGFAFSGKDILLAHIESPYAFAEIYFEKEGQVVINEPGQLMTIGDVSYKSFSGLSPIRAIEDSFSVLPIKKEFGYVNKLEMSVDITNEFSTATNCIIQASLCDTNGQWICSSSTNVLIQKGVTTATFGFLTSDIYATGIDGPYSVGCIALIVDNDREPSYRWIPNGEPIDVRFSDFGAYPFSVVGTPQYKEATLTNDAAVAVTVDVTRPNTITATALLVNSNGEYVAMAKVVEVVSETGKRTLVLTFDREEIVKSGKRGPYTIAYLVLKSDIEGVEDLKVEDFSVSDVGDCHFVLYVDGKNGDDANSGFSPMKPKRTIQAAVNDFGVADVIKVLPGQYEPFTCENEDLTIESIEGPATTIIDGGGTNRCATLFDGSHLVDQTNCVLRGFTIRNGRTSDLEGGGVIGGTIMNCVIKNCWSESGGGGAAFANLYNCIITMNDSPRDAGGLTWCKGYNLTVAGNKAPHNRDVVSGTYFNSLIGDGGADFYSCIVNLKLDSVLVDPFNGDCRLRAGSAESTVIDAGNNEYVKTQTDITGAARIQNGRVDIGAYEGSLIEGFVISTRIDGVGDVVQKTIVVQSGESATIEAVETKRNFLYWKIGNEQISNKVYTISNVLSDIVATAVFEKREWMVEGGGKTLQLTINSAFEGDVVWVGPGCYGAIISSNKVLRIESLQGPEMTIIDGLNTNCCAWLSNSYNTNTLLVGFTLRNGFVNNSNNAKSAIKGGGVCGGTVERCVISNCVATGNYYAYGGGAADTRIINSLIVNNRVLARTYSAYGGGVYSGELYNCTVIGNSAESGGVTNTYSGMGGGLSFGAAFNSIIWENSADLTDNAVYARLYNCCTDFSATHQLSNMITNDPQFVDSANGDYRLKGNSPCINQGLNGYVQSSIDLLGAPRIQDGVVDIGCYEGGVYTQIPDKVANLSARNRHLTWDESAEAVSYKVYRATTNSFGEAELVAEVTECEWTDNDAAFGAECWYWVVSVNPLGASAAVGAQMKWPIVYVNASATGNVDGTSLENGFTSLVTAYEAAEDGSVILVAPGIYKALESWDDSLAKPGIVFRAIEGAEKTIIDGGILMGSSWWSEENDNLERETFEGFTLRNLHRVGNLNLISCLITKVEYVGDSYLENCIVTKNNDSIYCSKVVGCTVVGNKGGVEGNGFYGLTSIVLNSIVVDNADPVWGEEKYGEFVKVDHSLISPLPTSGVGNRTGDPLFVDSANGDFRLRGNSPCIDAGSAANLTRTTDYRGNERSQNAAPDLGAIEGAVDGFVVSLRVDGAGEAQCDGSRTKVVQSGESATIEAVETMRNFLYWQIEDAQISNKVWTISNITEDIVATAVFAGKEHLVREGDSLQEAIDAAVDGDTIRVAAGTYAPISVTNKSIAIISTDGADVTMIDGGGTNRCAMLGADAGEGATLVGFTLINGCVEDSDDVDDPTGGGVYGGRAFDSVITNCAAYYGGGGAECCILVRCLLSGNHIQYGLGGGAEYCRLTNCRVLNNRITPGDLQSSGEGGGLSSCWAENCLIAENKIRCRNEANEHLIGGGAAFSKLYGCTVVNNVLEVEMAAGETNLLAECYGAGLAENLCLVNTISYGNTLNGVADDANGARYDEVEQSSCWIGEDPKFVDAARGNYRLAEDSPCINKGDNAFVTTETDLFGSPRIQKGVVDIGCYESEYEEVVPTLYVNASAIGKGDGSSLEDGFTSLEDAYNAAEAGSRILVAPGEYELSWVGKILTIKSIEGPEKTIISTGYIYGNRDNRWRESNDNLNRGTIEGFTLQASGWVDYLNLISCHLEDCSGIGESYLENCIVTRCKNNIYDSKLVGCSVYGSQTAIMGTDHSIIINSIIAVGDEVDPDGIFVNSFVADFTALGAGNTAVDPLFVDAANGDFRLRVGSPCIDAGCVTNTARTTDYFGNPRCLGARPDMGAIETPAVEGLVVSLRVDGAGEAYCDGGRTKVVQSGESVTIEAVETIRNFLYWQIGDAQISNKVWTISNIMEDVVATAVFELVDHHVSNGDSLQAAIDGAIDRETIYVAPGTYQSIDTGSKNLRIISTDGAAVTVIDGGHTNRCAYLGNGDGHSELWGLTLINGFSTDGAGVYGGAVYDSVISNCTAELSGGGSFQSTLYRCLVIHNKIKELEEGTIAPYVKGGGVYGGYLYNCQIVNNQIVSTNQIVDIYGAGVYGCLAEGCLIARNQLVCPNLLSIIAYGGGAEESYLYNCTIADNTIDVALSAGETNVVRHCAGAGIDCSYRLINTISYGNKLNGVANDADEECFEQEEMLKTCIIGTDPGFVDYANGNYRLTETSPAVDRGEDDESDLSVDLDGNPRVSGRAIDAGAYEYQWTSLWCSTTNFVLSGAAQTNSVVFGGSPNYQLVASDDWVELIGTTGVFAVAANTTGAAREGSIIIRGTSGDLVVRIFQDTWKTLPTGIYYGLFVGINNYESGLSSLDGCVSDATNMQNQCVNYGYWRRGKTQALLDGDASKAAIRSALRALAETAQSGDTVLYYHSGYGGNHTDSSGNFTDDVYLCATDANYEDYELADDLSQFKSGVRVIIMIDACHSGGMFKSKGRSAALPAKWNLAERVQQLMAQKRRVAVQSGAKSAASGGVEIGWVTACDSDEYSWDTPSGGEFTGYVLEGWSWFADQVEEGGDGDGYVNFLELANYAAKSATDMTVQRLNDELLVSTIAGVPQETIDSKYLEDALGAADSIAWSGDWLVQMEDAVDGLAAQSAEIGNAETSVLQGEVCGSGILSFKWRVSSEEGKDFLRFGLDGEGLCAISGEADWADVTVNVSGDDWHTLEWTYAKSKGGAAGEDCGRVDCVVWTPVESDGVQEISLGEALGAQGVAWRTTGAAKWCGIRRGFEAYAQTSPLADDQGAALAARLVGPGKLIFEWRVSSEMDCDMLNFSVNGEVKRYISGDTGWTQVRLDLADGTNDVAWVYAKDESGSNGEDRAYLRNVVWTGAALPIATETSTTPVPVPHSWLDQHAAILSAADGDYESAALAVGANGCAVWESFVAGLTPEDESSHFVSTIRFVDGKPVVEWIPALNGVGVREGVRRYTVYGVRNLGEAWQVVPEGGEGAFNFFKVAVELP